VGQCWPQQASRAAQNSCDGGCGRGNRGNAGTVYADSERAFSKEEPGLNKEYA
jgi:hypothetical protein